jgi:MoxR-like ATPase
MQLLFPFYLSLISNHKLWTLKKRSISSKFCSNDSLAWVNATACINAFLIERRMEDSNKISQESLKDASLRWEHLKTEVSKVIVGQTKALDKVMVGILAGGHILLEGAPGLAKTTLVRCFAAGTGLSFSRIQFTPDLLPSDVVGTMIYDPKSQDFLTKKGPIFASVVLADEINRAPAKVQSALLEAMAEHQVTIGNQTHKITPPFIVLATQNPLEQQGTYPLPEAQIDRFMLKVHIDYPSRAEELEVMARSEGSPKIEQILDQHTIEFSQKCVHSVFCDSKVSEYIIEIVRMTRPMDGCPSFVSQWIRFGASPRASIALLHASKAYAFLKRRNFVLPDDVKALALEVLRHRIVLGYDAEVSGVSTDFVVEKILQTVKTP